MSLKNHINKIMLVFKKGLILLILAALGWSMNRIIIKTVEMEALTIASLP